MNFKCLSVGSHKFTVEKPEEFKETNWPWLGVLHCPYCGSAKLEEVMNVVSTGPSLEAKRKENIARTMEAQKQAGSARADEDARNPDVVIKGQPNGEGRSQFDPGALSIRKETIDRITEKIQNSEVSKELVEGSLK